MESKDTKHSDEVTSDKKGHAGDEIVKLGSSLALLEITQVDEVADIIPAAVDSPKRKLLILDVNGLLADVVKRHDIAGGSRYSGGTIIKRPFCDDFLQFCFERFDVGIWSSRLKRKLDQIVDHILGDQKKKLLFCLDMSHCTETGFMTLENRYKPLVCKELRKIWVNDDEFYPNNQQYWVKGYYNESNTLLLDDSPYKALLNPVHTAIFPRTYKSFLKNDKSLGAGGDLRVYLEGLADAKDVRRYVADHPFGQSAIDETNSNWNFYSQVLAAFSMI